MQLVFQVSFERHAPFKIEDRRLAKTFLKSTENLGPVRGPERHAIVSLRPH